MKIDIDKVIEYSDFLRMTYEYYACQKRHLKLQRQKLSQNTNLDNVIEMLAYCERKIDEQLETLSRIRLALQKIADVYTANEKNIEDNFERISRHVKPRFIDYRYIRILGDVNWRII